MSFETVSLTVADGSCPGRAESTGQANAMNHQMWADLRSAFRAVDDLAEVRVAVISRRGNQFSAGIDLAMLARLKANSETPARSDRGERLRRKILELG